MRGCRCPDARARTNNPAFAVLRGAPADYHHSLSSLDSIARRCSREQVSQKYCVRPRSTAAVQVSGGSSVSLTVPQKLQVTMPRRLVPKLSGCVASLPG
jgi:hypothetical protein